MANLEALWVAGQLQPGKTILASEQAHYTHKRISAVLQLPCEAVACDAQGRMDMTALEQRLKKGNIGAVVATLGTTATGSVDSLLEILQLREKYGFRIHGDAAYGGYYTLVSNLDTAASQSFARIAEVDSIVIDPHKHGLQPYGCGCVLFRDPSVGSYTSTIRRTHISAPQNYTSAKSAWSAHAPEPPPQPCGLRKDFCHS